ncbi:MAG TPA: helix-turn-helix domain-containing protein, partial [Rhodanobacteraceae bacterium]|nr:helix-turn-helix domain-containing protein [Rhodanobacteraceae bacterium]
MNLAIPESTSGQPSFGQRLRAAREAKGLSHNDVAQRLRLPLRLIGRLENDDYSGMEQGVYLRGYLSSYARLVGVPTVAAETIASQHTHAAPLVATGKVSRSRYLFDRYSVSATYLILTGLIVVPAVWLATH